MLHFFGSNEMQMLSRQSLQQRGGTLTVNPLTLAVQVTTDPHTGHAPAANGEWISVYRGHQSAAQASPALPCFCAPHCACQVKGALFAFRSQGTVSYESAD